MKTKIALCLSLFALAGGCGSPQVKGLAYGDKRGCVNLVHNRVHLAIMTDGEMGSYGVRAGLFMAPRFSGTIELPSDRLHYRTRGQRVCFGDREYDLDEGCLFAITAAAGTPTVRQIDMPPMEMVRLFLENDAEINEFFRNGQAK